MYELSEIVFIVIESNRCDFLHSSSIPSFFDINLGKRHFFHFWDFFHFGSSNNLIDILVILGIKSTLEEIDKKPPTNVIIFGVLID